MCAGVIVETTNVVSYLQARSACNPDPVIEIAVYRGSAFVTLENGEQLEVAEGEQLDIFPHPTIQTASFTAEEVHTFQTQARQMGIEITEPADTTPTLPLESPTNLRVPTVVWLEEFSSVRVATIGEWEGSEPISFRYQWQGDCDSDGEGCLDIDGATEDTFQFDDASPCPFVRVVVFATNEAGTASATSEPFDLECVG